MKLADVHFSDHERVVVARLTGEIDLSNADSIEGAIAEATPNHALALILDMTTLDYPTAPASTSSTSCARSCARG